MIGVLITNGIGDVLMIVPAIRRLAQAVGPEHVLVVVGSPIHESVLRHFVDPKTRIVVRFDGRRFANLRLLWFLRRSAVQMICAPMLSSTRSHRVFARLVGKPIVVPSGFAGQTGTGNIRSAPHHLETFPGHQVDYYVQCMHALLSAVDRSPVRAEELRPRESLPKPSRAADSPSLVVIGVSCAKHERHKLPSPEYFARLVNALAAQRPVELLLIGAADDTVLIDRFEAVASPAIVRRRLIAAPLDDLLRELSAADLGISGTTGQGHFMAAAGLPLLVLAGVTHAPESGPFSHRLMILTHDLPCSPCYQEKFRQGCGVLACMETLDAQRGAELAAELLSRAEAGASWRIEHPKRHPVPVEQIRLIRGISTHARPSRV
jgi:ADP-heptose:LPS heptosyltransferase